MTDPPASTPPEAASALQFRPARAADEEFLAEAFISSRPEFAVLSPELLQLQLLAQRRHYASAYPGLVETVLEVAGQAVGRCLTWADQTELRLLDLAILERYRQQGIGRHVLTELLSRASDARLTFRLSVWPTNHRAIHLYQSVGLRIVSERNGYLEMQHDTEAGAPASRRQEWAERVGQTFQLQHRAGAGKVVLSGCRELSAQNSFAITFMAGPDVPIEQGTFELSASGFTSEFVFLVPIRHQGDPPATEFEAIFT